MSTVFHPQTDGATERANRSIAQILCTVEVNTSALLPTTLATVEPKSQVVVPAWSLPQPEAGPSQLPPPQPEARPSHLPSS